MLWSRDSKNRVLFLQRPDKTLLFTKPEEFLSQTPLSCDHDEHSRYYIINNLTIDYCHSSSSFFIFCYFLYN